MVVTSAECSTSCWDARSEQHKCSFDGVDGRMLLLQDIASGLNFFDSSYLDFCHGFECSHIIRCYFIARNQSGAHILRNNCFGHRLRLRQYLPYQLMEDIFGCCTLYFSKDSTTTACFLSR